MDKFKLDRGNQLEKEIDILKTAEQSILNTEIEDYWLIISKHKDGSGQICSLVGANVAKKVMDAVYAEIQNELALRKEEFEAL